MSDSDSDSSTASDAMLVIRSDNKSNRYARCYSRATILQLSGSPKVAPPKALKSLSEWYGDYEPPTPGHASSNTGGSAPHRQTSGGRNHPSGKGENWTDKEKSSWNERDRRERGDRNGSGATNTPATGAMGDFRLSGAKTYNSLGKEDKDRRGANTREIDGRPEEGLKPWNSNTRGDASERRRGPGEFVRKDGRAIEEGGWRTAKEAREAQRLPKNDRHIAGQGERDRTGDRRRQPAWMDDDTNASTSQSSYAHRTTTEREEAMPAWAADGADDTEGALVLEAPGNSLANGTSASAETTNKAKEASHIDSIQAWKAEMKEIERKRKAEEERALRREMGLPDLVEDKEASTSQAQGNPQEEPALSHNKQADNDKPKEAEKATAAPALAQKSVFADFLLPGPAGSSGKKEEDKPRSSRFAKIFGANAAPSNSPGVTSPPIAAQPSPANVSFASLLSSAAAASAGGKSPSPQNPDAQSMERLMNMLHMSSASATTSAEASPNPPVASSIMSTNKQQQPQITARQAHSNTRSRDIVAQAYQSAEVAYEPPLGQTPTRHSPPANAGFQHQNAMAQVPPRHQQQRQSLPHQAGSTPLSPPAFPSEPRQTPSGSRLGNRISGSQTLQGLSPEYSQGSQSSRREFVQPQQPANSPGHPHSGGMGVPLPSQQGNDFSIQSARSPQSARSSTYQQAEAPAAQSEQQQQHAHMLALLASQLQPGRQGHSHNQLYGQPNHQQPPPIQAHFQQHQQHPRQPQGNSAFAGPYSTQSQPPRQYPPPPVSNFAGQHFSPPNMQGQQVPPHMQQQQHLGNNYQNPHIPQHNFAPQNALAQLIAQGARAQQPRYPAPQQQHQPAPQQIQQNQIDLMALLTGAARR